MLDLGYMKTIYDVAVDISQLSIDLRELMSAPKTKENNDKIKNIIQTMERKLQTVWISTVEFKNDREAK